MSSAHFWSLVLDVKYASTLSAVFRRASSYCYRELNAPSPNVNRSGLPASIRVCLLSGTSTTSDLVRSLKRLFKERENYRRPHQEISVQKYFDQADRRQYEGVLEKYIEHVRVLPDGDTSESEASQLIVGGKNATNATFWLCSTKESGSVKGTITCNTANCYDTARCGLAIGSTDGAIKIWDFTRYSNGWEPLERARNLPATVTLNSRSGLSLPPFLTSRNVSPLICIALDQHEGSCSKVVCSSTNGDLSVWDIAAAELVLTVSADRIHQSALKVSNPSKKVTSLMLFRNRVVCGTASGLIRVFDLRYGKLTHRLAAHPDHVVATRTTGGVMWSGGNDGSVRWWGGRSAKVLSKSPICSGAVSTLDMDENVAVAGYSEQGIDAWDVRTQHLLCTFSNHAHRGVRSLQFDSTKLVTISNFGKAAIWEWNSPYPVYWMPTPQNDAHYVSSHFYGKSLSFATSLGDVYSYRL